MIMTRGMGGCLITRGYGGWLEEAVRIVVGVLELDSLIDLTLDLESEI